MTRDIVFHIGAHKTATTHLQNVLASRPRELRKHGVVFRGPSHLRSSGQGVRGFLGLNEGQDRDATLAKYCRNAPRFILSEENYIGLLTDKYWHPLGVRFYHQARHRLVRLARDLAPHPLTLALGVRDPAGLLKSLYGQALMVGFFRPWEGFIKNRNPADMQWSEFITRLHSSGAFAHIILWRFEDYPQNLPTVLSALCGGATPDLDLMPDQIYHPGLSARAVQAAIDWHAEGYKGPLGHIAREDYPVGDQYPAFQPWSQAMRLASRHAYDRDLARIKTMAGVTCLW